MVILGYIVALSTFSIAGRYVSLFLMACGDAGQSFSQLLTLPITDSLRKKRVCLNACMGVKCSSTTSSVSQVFERTHCKLSFSRKRAAAIGIVNGVGNIGNV